MAGIRVRRIAALGALLGCVMSLMLGAVGGVSAAPAAQGLVRLGPVHVMAVDDSGQGYAWSDICRRRCAGGGMAPQGRAGLSAPQAQTTPAPSYLLRMEKGRWFILADSTTAHVGRAVRWINEHHAEPFRVEDLARSSGLSVSAFHRKFRSVTGLSPIQFQKQVRLHRARLLLVTGAPDVASVGHQVGYDSISQFNREYRRQYGLPPGQDASRIRQGPDRLGLTVAG